MKEIMLATVMVDGVSHLPPDANSFSYSSSLPNTRFILDED